MANAVQVSEPPLAPQLTLYAVEVFDQTADHQHHSLHFSPIPRAPSGVFLKPDFIARNLRPLSAVE